MKKRKKQYYKALLRQWKGYHDIQIDYAMMRQKDWYKIIDIVKREGPERVCSHET